MMGILELIFSVWMVVTLSIGGAFLTIVLWQMLKDALKGGF